MTSTPPTSEILAALRASSTALCWKRAADMPSHLRIAQGFCTIPTTTPTTSSATATATATPIELSYSCVFPPASTTTTGALRGVVLFLHGINEHSERYFHLLETLAEMGFGTLAYDLRSHGKSHMDTPQLRAHIHTFQSFISDTNAFLTFAKREIYPQMQIPVDTTTPLIVMGMSLGSLVGVHTALRREHAIHGLVLLGPAVSVEITPLVRGLSWISGLLSALLPTVRLVPGVNQEFVCRDPLVCADYDADPLTTREPLTSRIAAEILTAMQTLQSDKSVEDPSSAFCQIPILMVMGSHDKVTSLPLARQFYDRIANADKQFEQIDGAFHVLLEDFERARVLHVLQQWLDGRFPTIK